MRISSNLRPYVLPGDGNGVGQKQMQFPFTQIPSLPPIELQKRRHSGRSHISCSASGLRIVAKACDAPKPKDAITERYTRLFRILLFMPFMGRLSVETVG